MGGEFRNSSFLDLSSMQSLDEIGADKITNSGTLVVPERLIPELTKRDFRNSGVLIPVPDGVRVELAKSSMHVSGEELASGDENAILIIGGSLYVTSPVEKVGYREIRASGKVYIPQGSEAVVRAKLGHVSGPTLGYRYPSGAKIAAPDEMIGRAFLEALPGPTPLIVFGTVRIQDDVTAELLRDKISEIVLVGTASATRELTPVIQALVTQKFGEIETATVGRDIYGTETLTKEYLELIPHALRLSVYGMLTIEADVSAELFDSKVIAMDTYGMTRAPKALVPLIQMKGDTYGRVEAY